MDDWMWKKIIEKMYDPKDFEVLESKFQAIIEEKRQVNKSRHLGATYNKAVIDQQIQA